MNARSIGGSRFTAPGPVRTRRSGKPAAMAAARLSKPGASPYPGAAPNFPPGGVKKTGDVRTLAFSAVRDSEPASIENLVLVLVIHQQTLDVDKKAAEGIRRKRVPVQVPYE